MNNIDLRTWSKGADVEDLASQPVQVEMPEQPDARMNPLEADSLERVSGAKNYVEDQILSKILYITARLQGGLGECGGTATGQIIVS